MQYDDMVKLIISKTIRIGLVVRNLGRLYYVLGSNSYNTQKKKKITISIFIPVVMET